MSDGEWVLLYYFFNYKSKKMNKNDEAEFQNKITGDWHWLI